MPAEGAGRPIDDDHEGDGDDEKLNKDKLPAVRADFLDRIWCSPRAREGGPAPIKAMHLVLLAMISSKMSRDLVDASFGHRLCQPSPIRGDVPRVVGEQDGPVTEIGTDVPRSVLAMGVCSPAPHPSIRSIGLLSRGAPGPIFAFLCLRSSAVLGGLRGVGPDAPMT
ncbi:unnamed protein product [Prorocentrum cordatum]|uniref:Uncharacterized protein n=1 Tax=Prorocentrum cordatum TaxID=2364126 RepID=A0ABN9YAR6_9DINO|nr:unnamed protein product [Polarella glacialis]